MFKTVKEWEAEREDWKKAHPIRHFLKYSVYYPAYRLFYNQFNVRKICREVKWFIQRGRRGWADCDTWSIDYYLNRIMPEMLESLARNYHGHPVNLSQSRWCNMLRRQAQLYRVMQCYLDNYRIKAANQCLKKIHKFMAKYYFSLWD